LTIATVPPEWNKQKKIKIIMAVENVPYSDAMYMFKNNNVNKIQSFSQVTSNNLPHISHISQPNNVYSQINTIPHVNPSSFPSLPNNNDSNSYNRKKKQSQKKAMFQITPLYLFTY